MCRQVNKLASRTGYNKFKFSNSVAPIRIYTAAFNNVLVKAIGQALDSQNINRFGLHGVYAKCAHALTSFTVCDGSLLYFKSISVCKDRVQLHKYISFPYGNVPFITSIVHAVLLV